MRQLLVRVLCLSLLLASCAPAAGSLPSTPQGPGPATASSLTAGPPLTPILSPTHTPSTSPTPADPTGTLRSLTLEALGESSRGVPRLPEFKVSSSARYPGYYQIDLTFSINEKFTPSDTRAGAKTDVFRVLKGLFTSGQRVGEVRLDGTLPGKDSTGAPVEKVVLRAQLTKGTADSIDWQNTVWARLWELLDSSWLDPSLQ